MTMCYQIYEYNFQRTDGGNRASVSVQSVLFSVVSQNSLRSWPVLLLLAWYSCAWEGSRKGCTTFPILKHTGKIYSCSLATSALTIMASYVACTLGSLAQLNHVLYIACCVLTSSIFLFLCIAHMRNPQRIPGPFLANWTPLWLIYHARQGHRFRAVHNVHQVSICPRFSSHAWELNKLTVSEIRTRCSYSSESYFNSGKNSIPYYLRTWCYSI